MASGARTGRSPRSAFSSSLGAVAGWSWFARLAAAALAVVLLGAACGGGGEPSAGAPLPAPAPSGTGADDSGTGDGEGTPAAGDGDASPAPPAAAEAGGDEAGGDDGGGAGGGADTGDADTAPPAPVPPAADEPAAFETVPADPEPSDAPPEGDDPAEAPEGGEPAEPVEQGTGGGGESEPPPNFYDDPRGGVFAAFQRGIDRDHPFGSLETFCRPHGAPAEALRATDSGIEAGTITLVHMRTLFEELVSMGFGVPVGDPTDMFDTFTRIVNERCGGVWGRRIDLRTVEVAALGMGGQDIDTLRNAACIEATESHQGVIVMNTTTFAGTAQLCITEEHDAVLIGHEPLPDEYVRRGGGRLLTTTTTQEESLVALARYVIDTGALEGRRVAVVAPNAPGEAETVEASLLAVLDSAGVDVAAFDVIDCGGTSICTGGMAESVQRLIEEGVDVLFPTLNAVSLPAYITEMVTQGFAPGDVQFYNSDFNSQGNEVVGNLIVTFGGAAAGELYDGAILLVKDDAGRFRDPDWEPVPFGEMCMREYRENSPLGEDYDPRDPEETNKYGILSLVCSEYRMALRALYDAGPNPTRADIVAALESLGAVDLPGMLPGSLAPGKWAMGDSLQPVTFRYPCPFVGTETSAGMCLESSDYSELRIKVN